MFQAPKVFSGHRGAVYALAAQDETAFFSGGAEGWISHWQGPQAQGQLLAKVPGAVLCLHYLKEAQILVIGTLHGEVFWLDLVKKQNLKRWPTHPKGVMAFCRTRTGELASVGADGQVTWWDLERHSPRESWPLSEHSLRFMVEHPQRNGLFLLGGSDGALRWLDAQNAQGVQTQVWPNAHQLSVFAACFSPDGLWTGGRDAQIRAWEPNMQEEIGLLHVVPAHLATVNDLCYLPNWGFLASASRDKSIKIWEIQGPHLRLRKVLDAAKYGLHRHSVNRLLPWAGGLLSASDDGEIAFWTLETT